MFHVRAKEIIAVSQLGPKCVYIYMAIPALWHFRFSCRRMEMCVVPNQLGAQEGKAGKQESGRKLGEKRKSAQLTRFRQVQQAGEKQEERGVAEKEENQQEPAAGPRAVPVPAEDSPSQRAGVY